MRITNILALAFCATSYGFFAPSQPPKLPIPTLNEHKTSSSSPPTTTTDPYIPYFDEWHCLGIFDRIDFRKPHITNIGELPLVVWKDNRNQLHTAINICKHMGTRFDNGKITDSGCLKCPYHGLEYDDRDAIGQTVLHQGRIFWSYRPKTKTPPSVPFYDNPNYETSFIQIDMPCSLPDAALNTMDLIHPEYVHSNLFGFGNSVPPLDIRKHLYPGNKNMVGLSFNYVSRSLAARGSNFTENFNMFYYPNFGWSKVRIPQSDCHLIIGVNFLPLEPKRTRWTVTIVHDYYKTPLKKMLMRFMTACILFQDYTQIIHQYEENEMKRLALFNFMFKNEPAVLHLKDMFRKDFVYPTIEESAKLYRHYLNKPEEAANKCQNPSCKGDSSGDCHA
jgi:nitrite reductase/ring-hydroxylating ferredoxin subunit